jgi:hypothetical protein
MYTRFYGINDRPLLHAHSLVSVQEIDLLIAFPVEKETICDEVDSNHKVLSGYWILTANQLMRTSPFDFTGLFSHSILNSKVFIGLMLLFLLSGLIEGQFHFFPLRSSLS